jgi:transcriptional regulator with XRE-family HTH domain
VTQQFRRSSQYNTDSFETITPRSPSGSSASLPDWGAITGRSIATRIREWRNFRKLSAQQLADRCARLGYEVPRNVITNIENGRRSAVSVPELLILAMALNVPPALLIFGVGNAGSHPTAPQRSTDPWHATQWLVGDAPPVTGMLGTDTATSRADAAREWEESSDVLLAFKRHDLLVRRYRLVREDMLEELKRLAQATTAEADAHADRRERARTDFMANDLARAAESLQRHRRAMQESGYVLPQLPPDVDLP